MTEPGQPQAPLGHAAAACQTDLANPIDRAGMRGNTDRMLSMLQSAVERMTTSVERTVELIDAIKRSLARELET